MKRALVIAAVMALPAAALAQTDGQFRYACKQFVERSLHDPGSASLDWTEGSVSKNDQGHHVVRFRGRAKNAYGALVLSTFQCVLRYTHPDHFTPVSVQVLK